MAVTPYPSRYTSQPLDLTLSALADLPTAPDTAPYFTDIDQAALMTVSPLARSLLDDTTTAAMRATLEIPEGGGTPTGTPNKVAIFNSVGTLTSDTELHYDAVTNFFGIGMTPQWTFDIQSTQVQGTTAALFHTARIVQDMTLSADSTLQSFALQVESNFNSVTFFPTGNAAHGAINVRTKYLGQATIPSAYGVRATLENAGVGSVVTGYGFSAEAPVIGSASFQFFIGFRVITTSGTIPTRGFRGQVSSGSGRYNLYMDGTAQNYMIGNLGIGSGKTVPAESIDTAGGIRLGAAIAANDGTIQYAAGDFQGRKAGAWVSLVGGTMAQQNANAVAITGGSVTGQTDLTTGNLTVYVDTALTGFTSTKAGTIIYLKNSSQAITIRPADNDTGIGNAMLFVNVADAPVGAIGTTATTTSYFTTSDARLKHAIAPLAAALDVVRALRPVHFLWNANDEPGEGFLAHELMRHVPAAVTGLPDEVNDDGSVKPQQVDQSKLVPWLTAALQEMLTRLELLEARA